MSETVISGVTRVVAEECGVGGPAYSDTAHSDLDIQVHVVGVSEGSIGLGGAVTTSPGIVDLMNRPLADAAHPQLRAAAQQFLGQVRRPVE